MRYFLLLIFYFLLISVGAYANDMAHGNPDGFYQDRERGWYWFEVFPEKTEDDEDTSSTEAQNDPIDGHQDYTYEEMWSMDPDRFKEYADNVTKLAIQYQTEENIVRHLKVMDVTRRKSTAFANSVAYYGQKNPQYDMQDVYPITTPGRKAVLDMKFNEIDTLLYDMRDQYALIMFTRSGCKFCIAQSSILSFFVKKYQWPVREIHIDENPNMSAQFGIDITPSLIIVSKETKDHILLSTGVISMSDLKERIFRGIRFMNGETTPGQWSNYAFEKQSGSDPLKFLETPERISPSFK